MDACSPSLQDSDSAGCIGWPRGLTQPHLPSPRQSNFTVERVPPILCIVWWVLGTSSESVVTFLCGYEYCIIHSFIGFLNL